MKWKTFPISGTNRAIHRTESVDGQEGKVRAIYGAGAQWDIYPADGISREIHSGKTCTTAAAKREIEKRLQGR